MDSFFAMSDHPFSGFGDDPNWSVKFHVLMEGDSAPDWQSDLRMATLTPAIGNGEITQRRGRDPYQISFRLWLANAEDHERLEAMVGRRATLRYAWGVTKTLGTQPETIQQSQYQRLPDTMLIGLDRVAIEGDGTREVTATFRRIYIDPAPFTPPVWPAPPYPGQRLLPDPTLFLTQPFSRNAAGAISAASGAARAATVGSSNAWRIIPAAKNAVRNPLFSGTGQWSAVNATLTANGDGTARMQASNLFDTVDVVAGTGLPAVQGETVTISVQLKSRTTNVPLNIQYFGCSANNYTTVTTSWQTFTYTRTLTDAATQYVLMCLTLSANGAFDVDIRNPMIFKGSTVPEMVPAVVGGVLQTGDAWDGTPNASSSTRTAGSVGGSLASFGSLYVRYSTDGSTVVNTVLTAPGAIGTGTVAYSGGFLTITSSTQVWLLAAIAYPTLSPSQKTYLDSVATSALTWSM